MEKTTSNYEDKVLAEHRDFEADYNGMYGNTEFGAGACQFCNHPINMGYRLKDKATGELLIVGCDCFGTLLRLDKNQIKILKHQDAINRNRKKYAKIYSFLEEKHKGNYNRIAFEIMRKISKTSVVNKWWFEEYKRLYDIDLLEINKGELQCQN